MDDESDNTLPALQVLLASRRDTLLLLLLYVAVTTWVWERGIWATLLGTLSIALLFPLLVSMIRDGQRAARALDTGTPGGTALAAWDGQRMMGMLFVGLLPAMLLVARLAWLLVGSRPLTLLMSLLALGWQLWLYFWMAPAGMEAIPRMKEQG